ncbi:MAG: TonB-dependent receptor [Burkholderiaceae bacterium]|nr:TonB-dependent receptor [Burkholderiaceae bacterium]
MTMPVLTAQAQSTGDAPADAKLEKIVVTGSNVRRIDKETPSPVQVLSADDMKQSGYTSVEDVLHNITANNMGSLSQANAEAFAAGGGGVSLRGLTVGATLVLINGHRMAPYPMPDDGERDFVDLASIPFEAIERVEILKDGASAVYGSDAMAGVVNVILKKNVVGTSMVAEAGTSYKGDGSNVHLAGTHGFGDLDADGYNLFGSLEYKHQDSIALSSRPYLAVTDWTPYGGANLSSQGSPYYQLQPKTQNLNALAKFTKKLNEDWEFNVQASIFNSQATQVGVFNSILVQPGATNFTIPTLSWGPANYNNPVVGSVGPFNLPNTPYYQGVTSVTFPDMGPQTQTADTTSYRLVTELSGDLGAWTIEAALGFTRVETQLTNKNFLSASAFNTAMNNGSYYLPNAAPANLYAPLTGVTAATYAALLPTGVSTSVSDLDFFTLRGTREVTKLPGGPLSVGTGIDFTYKKLDEQFPPGFASGDQTSPIYSFAQGSQQIAAAYAELVAPVLKTLELDAAARIDHYNTYGSSTTPKVGFKFTPMKEFTLRGTYAEGFRAPNAAEMGVSGSTSGKLSPVTDPANGALVSIPELQLSNPHLKPEKSDSYTLGIIFEPNKMLNVSIDYYDITIKNQISSPGLLGSIQLASAYDPVGQPGKTSPNNPYLAEIFRNPDGSMAYETYKFVNASQTHTNGLDMDFRLKFDLQELGSLSSDLSFTHMFKYDADFFGTTYALAGTHGPGFVSGDTGTPQDRAALTTTWRKGPIEITGTINYTSGMSILDPSYGNTTCALALPYTFPSGTVPSTFCHVPSFTTFNLAGKYDVSKQFSVHASVVNLFNRHAPYDLQTFGSAGNGAQYGGAPYNPALHQDGALGAFLNVGASYRF